MKKILTAFVLCLLLMLGAACAEETARIMTIETAVTDINGGVDCEMTMKTTVPFNEYTVVTASNADLGWTVEFPFCAGDASCTVMAPTPVVEKKQKATLAIDENAAYTVGDEASVTLQLYALPRVQFYKTVHIGYVGKELNVILECKNPAAVLKDYNTVELRDETGRVYGTRTWSNPSKRTNLSFTVTEEMLGRHNLSVWYGGVCVTEPDDGYCAISVHGEKIISTFETDEPYMSITLDCAYSDDRTLEILDILDKYNVKVTFFMTGHYVNTFTETAREMVRRGHEIGNHSLSHPNLATQCTQVNKRLEQIRTPVDDIQNLLGVRVRLFRPPYGAYDGEVLAMVRAEGMEMTKWTIDSHDWDEDYKNSPERIVRRVKKDVKGGNIILFHIDGFNTPEVLDEVIPYYQNELGLNLVTVSELCEVVGRELPPLPYAEQMAGQ